MVYILITVETQKYFNLFIYNTYLNGRIYPSYSRKTQKPRQTYFHHSVRRANSTGGHICQKLGRVKYLANKTWGKNKEKMLLYNLFTSSSF